MNWELISLWVAGLLTLAIYSFLYKDNPFYKFAEHLYVGVSTGYLVVIALGEALRRDLYEPLFINPERDWIVIIPGILGLLLFTRFFKKIAFVSRISIAFVVGVASGISIPNQVQTMLLRHTEATILPLYNPSVHWMTNINNILILIGVLTVLIYFFFSIRHEGAVKPVSRVGVIYLMLYFGASFGYTVMGRVSLLIGRMRFLILEWVGYYIDFGG